MSGNVCYGVDDASCTTAYAASRRMDLKSKKAVDKSSYYYTSGIVLYGLDSINSSWPAYCDHYHLYSFYYDTITPVASSDFTTDLSVWAGSMVGFPNACTYTDWIAISTPVVSDTVWATTGDQFAWTCGYYA
jgi:hypothetical protein